MTPLAYRPDVERPEADEQKTIDGIIEGMSGQTETVEKRERHAVRASHAKRSACVVGKGRRPAGRTRPGALRRSRPL